MYLASIHTYILGVHPVTWCVEFRYQPGDVALQLLAQRILRKDIAEVHCDLQATDLVSLLYIMLYCLVSRTC